MGMEVYFDRTGKNNEVKIDSTANAVKIDPSSNSVKVTGTVKIDSPRFTTTNVGNSKTGPVKAGDVICSIGEVDAGYYEVDWLCGITGRPSSESPSANIKLTIGVETYQAAYETGDNSGSITPQPKIKINLTNTGTDFKVVIIKDDTNKDQNYVAVLNVTRIA